MSLSIAFFSLAILINSASQIIFKAASFASGGDRVLKIAIGMVLGTCYVFIYSKSLERIRLGIAYPALSCTSLIIITLASVLLFKETISVKSVVGMALAVGGISLIAG